MFNIKRHIYYFINGKNKYTIHSQHAYDYYTKCYLTNNKKDIDTLIEQSKTFWINDFGHCLFIIHDMQYISNNVGFIRAERYITNGNRYIKEILRNATDIEKTKANEENIIIIYKNINISPEALSNWHNVESSVNSSLSIETYYIGIIFKIEGFCKQKYILRH